MKRIVGAQRALCVCLVLKWVGYRVEHKKWDIELVYGTALGTC